MKISPRNANSFDEVCSLKTDNEDTEEYWILLGTKIVTICNQIAGEGSKGVLEIPKDQFNKLIDWYNKDQNIKQKRAI